MGRRLGAALLRPEADRAAPGTAFVTDHHGANVVTVTYRMTAVDDANNAELADFAADYVSYLESWREAILASL